MGNRIVVALLLAAVGSALPGCGRPAPPPETSGLAVANLLGSTGAEGFALALEARPFEFPRDHGPHPEFRSEWWYLTGNLEAAGDAPGGAARGRRFGYQLTFFRQALLPDPPPRESAWAANQIYMAHFALTDVETGTFHAFERFSRGAAGLAGARAAPLRVWLEDWTLESPDGRVPPLRLTVSSGDVGLELALETGKPVVLQGDRGLSRKGAEPGNASYYYSFTRLPTVGTVRLAGRAIEVAGTTWMDREWSTSVLEEGQTGWDWFSLQLDDGTELMAYRLRRRDGSPDPHSSGSLVEPDGRARRLAPADVEVEVLGRWRSPRTGVEYPARWRLAVPDDGLELEIAPLLAGQELDLSVRYWEGAVRAEGRRHGEPVRGYGYVELTGYGD